MKSAFLPLLVSITLAFAARADVAAPTNDPAFRDSANYFLPNEFEHWRFYSATTQDSGTLIAVGGLGGLHLAAYGRYDQVVFMDFDLGVCQFNRILIEKLKTSKNRFEFLSQLLGISISPAEIDVMEKSPRQEVRMLLEKLSAQTPARPDWIGFNAGFSAEKLTHYFQKILIDAQNQPELWATQFMGNSALYERVSSLAAKNKLSVLLGSLTGSRAMVSLGEHLRAKGKKVSTIYSSNAHFWPKFDFNQMFENFKALPLSKDAQLLWTSMRAHPTHINFDGFTYFHLPLNDPRLESIIRSCSEAPLYGGKNDLNLAAEIPAEFKSLRRENLNLAPCVKLFR